MWIVYYADDTLVTSDDQHWSEISERTIINETAFDILTKPAYEIRVQLHPTEAIHRLRSPEPVKFFHYHRVRSNLFNPGQTQVLYEAIGYCFTGGRVVLEVTSGMGVTRVELGAFSFDEVTL